MADEPIRLQKLLAQAGIGSRRFCEILIERGRVTVNGVVISELGARASWTDRIQVDGIDVISRPEMVVFALNKPLGVVSSMADEHGRPCLGDLVKDLPYRLFHVGRLDEQSEGLLILTNDGELAQRLSHPRYEISKTYLATVDGDLSRGDLRRLLDGVELDDGPIHFDQAILKQVQGDQSIVEVVLHSGRNRIVRRTLAAIGHPVRRLVRTHIGGLGIDGLRPGQLRELSSAQVFAMSRDSNWDLKA